MADRHARASVGQAVELRDRLPRLWARVMTGELRRGRGCGSPRLRHDPDQAAATLTALTGPDGNGLMAGVEPVARVTRLGARSTAAITRWLADLAPGATITLTPVVDLAEHIAVDAHQAPDRLRNLIEEREHTCGFPWCGRRGRDDLDHIDPYPRRTGRAAGMPTDQGTRAHRWSRDATSARSGRGS